jgi:serine/threonine protein phosphatase 1
MRLYAIGDIHGCDTMLADMHARIAADLAERPVEDHRIVHVGDYIDRGPDCAGVIGRLARLTAEDGRVVCLVGNHDTFFNRFLDDPEAVGELWLANGAEATLASYGVTVRRSLFGAVDFAALAQDFTAALPAADRAFMAGLRTSVRFGDYLFVHAGIRPGVPLDRQDPEDMIWIREPFLEDASDLGVVVIHGHTPVDRPDVQPNRIDIDTGAVYGGPLTCLVLDGTRHRFLQVEQP